MTLMLDTAAKQALLISIRNKFFFCHRKKKVYKLRDALSKIAFSFVKLSTQKAQGKRSLTNKQRSRVDDIK